ncbi:hypothetical protein IGI04_019011 [Brassica rapa subsp. trilocularis]|uniref:Uncharacterized protein n=1 Tax=Brassica rapa subsp. trilocularis TaxID=1813537 RepID=A0ABQ7MF00_BRACM|nr:hypothetical protein IGI04_019011 [Brassica rapa subsp. trilocularis]
MKRVLRVERIVPRISSTSTCLYTPPRGSFLFPFLSSLRSGPFRAVFRLERLYYLSKQRFRNDIDSEEGSNFSYGGGSMVEAVRGSIQSRRRELRGRGEGRLVDPTRQTGLLDDLLDPNRPFGELDGAFGPTRPFGELDDGFFVVCDPFFRGLE